MKPHRLDLLIIIGIFTLALTVRIMVAWSVFQGDRSFPFGDDDDYYRIAISLVETGRFATDGNLTAYRMPFFPLFLAFWHAILGTQPYAALPVLLVLGSLIPVGTYLLACTIADRKVGLIAGLLMALDLDLIIYSRLYMTETLFIFLVLFSMLALARLRVLRTWQWAVTTGLLCALTTLTRANFGPFVAVALLWLVFTGRDRLSLALRHATVIAVIVAVFWSAWVVRNYLVFNSFIPLTTQGGNAYYGIYNDKAIAASNSSGYGYWIWLNPELPKIPGKVWSEAEWDAYQRELAREWKEMHPEHVLPIALSQAIHFWKADIDIFSYLRVVLPGICALLFFGLRLRSPDLILWLLLAITMTFLSIVSVGVARYHLPLRPFLATTTAMALSAFALWLVDLRQRLFPLATPVNSLAEKER